MCVDGEITWAPRRQRDRERDRETERQREKDDCGSKWLWRIRKRASEKTRSNEVQHKRTRAEM